MRTISAHDSEDPPVNERFDGSFTQQEPIPEDAIEAAVAVMRTGRLHRYNVVEGEVAHASALEVEYARYQGARYCLAVTSGGQAIQLALRAAGVKPGESVLTNAFTLAPVPGAVEAVGARSVLVETTDQLVICLEHLAEQARATGARWLLLSHMRGHIVDMDQLMALTRELGVTVIEDCAHTMGAAWNGVRSGSHGRVACFSTQTYKHMNSGEGGLITTDDAELMARATVLSGSYMLYGRHDAAPPEDVFARVRLQTPNCSARLDNVRAAMLRPQLALLDRNVERWHRRYQAVSGPLASVSGLRLTVRSNAETFVGSSMQFFAEALDTTGIQALMTECRARGVELKWFGEPTPVAYTSRHDSWQYMDNQSLPRTDAVLAKLMDMRIPLTFSEADCALVGRIIASAFEQVRDRSAAA